MRIHIEIGAGELFDRISILEIKLERIDNPDKLKNVRFEHASLSDYKATLLASRIESHALLAQMKSVNEGIWGLEDDAREAERTNVFGDAYIQATREIHRLNDRRAMLKKQINILFESSIIEEKGYDNVN